MNPTWILLLSLYANPQPSLQIPDHAMATEQHDKDKSFHPSIISYPTEKDVAKREKKEKEDADRAAKESANIRVPLGTINLTMTPPGPGDIPVNKMTGVEADTRVYVPSAVQVPFPSKDGCEAAAKAAEKVGKGVCLEIR